MWPITSLQYFMPIFLHIWLVDPCLKFFPMSSSLCPDGLPIFLPISWSFSSSLNQSGDALRKWGRAKTQAHTVYKNYISTQTTISGCSSNLVSATKCICLSSEKAQNRECFPNVSQYMLSSQCSRKRYIFTATIC